MKSETWLTIIFILCFIGLMLIAVMCSGCSLFQISGADKIASLPETPQQQLFQTIAKTNWLFTLSVVGVGAGFFAFLNGSSKGLQFMASCFVVLSLIIGVTKYSAVIAAIAMIGAVCLMIYSTLVKGKALREVIQGVQDVREEVSTDHYIVDNALNNIQSKTTKAIVKVVKGKL